MKAIESCSSDSGTATIRGGALDGGVEANETDETAALRELREELGEAPVELGLCIWTRRHVGVFRGQPFDQSERIYLGRVTAFEPRPSPEALLEHAPR